MKKETKSKEMDLLNGGLAGKLILFAIPLALSSILQQLFNLISCEAAFGYEQVAKRIANIRLTALQEDILALPAVRIWVYRDTEHRFYDLG